MTRRRKFWWPLKLKSSIAEINVRNHLTDPDEAGVKEGPQDAPKIEVPLLLSSSAKNLGNVL